MTRLIVAGNRPLSGAVSISGHKNAAIALIPASLLASSPTTLTNLPDIGDVRTYLALLDEMGVRTETGSGKVILDSSRLETTEAPQELAGRIRASYYMLGALLGRCGRAAVPLPGGCNLGARPIDQHLKGLQALGARVDVSDGWVRARCERLRGADISLDTVSVGATINIMLAAVLAEGTTRLSNAAREPHVCDVASYLNSMGAHITGIGTSQLTISGVRRLRGVRHSVVPDDIEAATYLLAAAATGGTVRVERVVPENLTPVIRQLEAMGLHIRQGETWVQARCSRRPRPVDLTTGVYPGFPTDAHPLFLPALCQAAGTSRVTETVWPKRFTYVEPLRNMGAQMDVRERSCMIHGVGSLFGTSVTAPDLRTGAALVIAGLAARGTTVVHDFDAVERGYERMPDKFKILGASVHRVPGSVEPDMQTAAAVAAVASAVGAGLFLS